MSTSIFCPHCHKHTALSVAPAKYTRDYDTYYTKAQWIVDNGERWWIGICNGCQQPCMVKNDGAVIYPTPLPTPTDANIPRSIATDLDEAKLCFSSGCYRACAAMARRAIQNAALEKGAAKGDLVSQIQELTKSGVITKDIAEWATVVRWVGNDAAHPNPETVTQPDAEDVLKLAEQFMHVVFVAPAIAKARKAARGK